MKKYNFLFLFLLMFMLCGCSSNNKLTKEDYILTEDNITSKNITIGNTSEEFKNAYNNYIVTIIYAEDAVNGDNIADIININDIDFSKQCNVGITTYYIDNKSYTIPEFVDKLGIKTNYYDWAKENTEYLENHIIEGKVLIFTFEDGIVSNISSTDINLETNQ